MVIGIEYVLAPVGVTPSWTGIFPTGRVLSRPAGADAADIVLIRGAEACIVCRSLSNAPFLRASISFPEARGSFSSRCFSISGFPGFRGPKSKNFGLYVTTLSPSSVMVISPIRFSWADETGDGSSADDMAAAVRMIRYSFMWSVC